MNTTQRYDDRTIRLHWACAALVLVLWMLGQVIDFFPRGDPRVMARSVHIALGVVLACLLLARIVWRIGGGTKLPAAESGFAGLAATSAHKVLYLLMACTVLVGIAAVWVRGDNLFNLYHVPAFDPTDKQLRKDVVELHETLANSLFMLALLHAAVAVFHHTIRADGVLQRMWPARTTKH